MHDSDIPYKIKTLNNMSAVCTIILAIVSCSSTPKHWANFPTFRAAFFCYRMKLSAINQLCKNSPLFMAANSLTFHCSATSFARGSSGFGALNKAWIERRTVLICNAGLHLSEGNQNQKMCSVCFADLIQINQWNQFFIKNKKQMLT